MFLGTMNVFLRDLQKVYMTKKLLETKKWHFIYQAEPIRFCRSVTMLYQTINVLIFFMTKLMYKYSKAKHNQLGFIDSKLRVTR